MSTSKRCENWCAPTARLTICMMADQLGIDKELVRSILVENLGMRKVCAKMVPRLLSEDQKTRPTAWYANYPAAAADGHHTLRKGHHRWRIVDFLIWPRKQSIRVCQWKSPGSPRSKKARMQKSQVKVMLITFFDHQGMVHHEYVPLRSDSKPTFLQRGTDLVDGKKFGAREGSCGRPTPGFCTTTMPQHTQPSVSGSFLATKTGHHSWPPSLFARLGSVRLFFISEAEREHQGDSFLKEWRISSPMWRHFWRESRRRTLPNVSRRGEGGWRSALKSKGITLKEIISVLCLNF